MAAGRRLKIAGGVALAAFAALYLGNASWMARPSGAPSILAHRGVHQAFASEGLDDATCTATRIGAPIHGYIENTLPSMARAFALGADTVEIDIHPTADGEFAVFHDWTLECRTDGRGVTREHSLAELKALDAGYGYTADGGRTFPLRGRGVGLIPGLAETLAAFPRGRFMVNIKSNDPAEGDRLAAYLSSRAPAAIPRLVVYGGQRPIARLKTLRPDLRAFDRAQFKACMLGYLALGWSGHTPAACRRIQVFVPQAQAWLLWGWPNRFLARMQSAGTEVYIAGDLKLRGRQGLGGLDDPARLAALPRGWKGGVSTDRIERIGPLLRPGG